MLKYVFFIVSICLFASCNTLQYKTQTTAQLPELGTIGAFTNYLLDQTNVPKTVVAIDKPIRLYVEKIDITKRALFEKEDEPSKKQTQLRFSILDKLGLLQQINSNVSLLEQLKLTPNNTIVSQVVIDFSEAIETQIFAADEIYLVQDKEKTLSIELRKDSKVTQTIDFAEGVIKSFETSQFCWGKDKRHKIVIFDLVAKNTKCGVNLYKTATKAKEKNEFKF